MEEEEALPNMWFLSSDDDNDEGDKEEDRQSRRQRRSKCWEGCGRPVATCICPLLPPSPIPTSTHVVVLHHPQELRTNKIATLPALCRCLERCSLLCGRRLHPGASPLLDSLSAFPSPSSPVLFLFPTIGPSESAIDLKRWVSHTPYASRAEPVLIVFDATWRYAREMVAASLPYLERFALQVQIGDGCDAGIQGASTFESDVVLRKEPWKGCLSTIEAVARALRVLEPEERGPEIEERLLAVLRAMVAFQAVHLTPVKPRTKLKKKGKVVRE
ncbi:hypothetical protein HPP92_015438 [Vanilla planifolia]|uniref:tRNA-uridine aminocarboxypropyltransferase n=1 Tax=Vanilla planifolia TaxID=51239 RepID=A0A835QXS3_VANPL|nr:hypothetical protein HPP92_015438 [Vanilla planifolia]